MTVKDRVSKKIYNMLTEDYNFDVMYVYHYGSRVYGTSELTSDWDFIVVVKQLLFEKIDIRENNYDITVYDGSMFLSKLFNEHHISMLECIYQQPEEWKHFTIDSGKLRRAISSVASNSFVKCKKKLREGEDYNPRIGKKSLFHSLRILMFGIQIAKHGKIVDFGEANYLYEEIMAMDTLDWEVYKEKYTPLYNKLKSEFKRLAPLDIER